MNGLSPDRHAEYTCGLAEKRIIIFLNDLLVIAIMISFKITLFCAFQNLIKGISI